MYLPLSHCLSFHALLRVLLFALGGSKRKCAPTSIGVIGALSYLAVLPLYFILHVYFIVYIVIYLWGWFVAPTIILLR